MTRKEFLIIIWKRFFKPILWILTIYLGGRFIYNLIWVDGTERFVVLLLSGLSLFVLLLSFIGMIVESIVLKVRPLIPPKWKKAWAIILRILDYIAPFAMVYILYWAWKKDPYSLLVLVGVWIFEYWIRKSERYMKQKE